MSKRDRYLAARAELDRIRETYCKPHYEVIDQVFREYWNEGYTVEQITEELGWLQSSVKTKLAKLGIDWRERESNDLSL